MPESRFHPGDQIGHYRLTEWIGGGGQGEVWRARDERFDCDRALKILPEKALSDDTARERFRREARAVGKLNHPNIATAYDFDTKPVEYLVTEFVEGVGLDAKLTTGALPESAVLALALQLAAGLEAAHHQGIIHRDLKPGNLRITPDGHLKILDFGLAEMFDPTKDITSLETITITMTLTGTLPYMAPEQFSGNYDQRSDIWSMGAVLYEMATGKLLFPEARAHEIRDSILNQVPAPPRTVNPNISSGLEQVILRCLQKRPEKRYQTATELREDLERVHKGHKTAEGQVRQGRLFALLALAAVLLISAAAAYRYWPQIRHKLWPSSSQRAATQFRLVAILPVSPGGANPSDDALVRGMAQTVSVQLARSIPGQKLQLIPPEELIARGTLTSDAARKEFGVDRVLEVSVQRAGDKVRATCSLIDPITHQLVTACSVTGDKSDLFALQDNLVGEVLAMLPADMRSPQAEPSEVQAAAPAGYEFYLKGKGYLLDYHKPENIDAAIKEFEHALQVSPNYAPAYAGLGEAYWHGYKADRGTDWLERAKLNCQKALAADPKSAEGHTCLGNLYNDTGHYEQAVEEFHRAISSDPTSADALNGLAEAYDRMGNASAAEETYKKAITLRPQYWAVYNWLGYFYYGQARYADAATMFQKVVEFAPDNHRGYLNLSAMHVMEGRYDDAITAANRSVELKPSMSGYSNLGEAYYYLHRYPEAIAAFEKAKGLDEQDYLNWGNLADALYWSPDRRTESTAAYKKAIELARARLQVNPKDTSALAYVAEYSAMIGDTRTAPAQLQKALALAPTDPDVMFRAALVYNQLGDKRQTLDWLKKAVAARFSRTTVRDTPDFVPLQSDPEFRSLIAGV